LTLAVLISDTSPIHALGHLGLLALLRDLFGQVVIPPAVQQELMRPPPRLLAIDVSQLAFVQIQAPQNHAQVQQLLQTLDPGESEALVLAVELQVSTLLIDEMDGRAVATQLGLVPLGTLGVLLRAKQRGLINAVRPLMDRLENEIQFFISPQLRADVLRLAGE
jgi:uncharacterized protein